MRRLVIAAALLANGCALAMSANAHHNSRGTACVASPAFAMIDLGIGFASAAAVAASEESAGYYAIPGVFLASGVIGGISAARCGDDDDEKEKAPDLSPPASNSAPSWNADVDPDAIDPITQTVPREMIDPAPDPAPPSEARPPHPFKLRLPANYTPPPEPPPPPKISCRDSPSACPPSMTCAIAGSDAGYCVD